MTPTARTLAQLRRVLRGAVIGARNLDDALTAGMLLGEINWRNNDGLLADDKLEEELFRRHGAALAVSAPLLSSSATEWLHVISEAYTSGGHTRLLSMLLAAQIRAGAHATVAVTRNAPLSFLKDTKALGAGLHCLTGTPSTRTAQLLALGRSAKRIILHIHPDDLGAALAARQLRAEGRQVLFVNHADHVFSYGVGAADICLEVSGFGWRLSKARRPVRTSHFLGIPVTESAQEPQPRQPVLRAGPLFSMGSAHKYKPAGGYDFPAFISDVLDRTGFSAEIVGPKPSDPWWAAALARHGGRLQLLGPLSFAETSTRLAAAACYVDSFPINGGTSFPQALLAGKTIFGPGSDAGGYSLADALRFPSVKAMIEGICKFFETGAPLDREQDLRARIAMEFNAEAIAEGLRKAVEGRPAPPPAELLAAPRSIDWYPQMWRSEGVVDLWRKKQPVPLVGLRSRLEMALHFLGRAHVIGGPEGKRALLRWVAEGVF